MPWHDAQALHIFVPPREPYSGNWVEQILGDVLKPLLSEYYDKIPWLWVTRYAGPYDEDQPPLGIAVPAEFHADGRYRYIVLRLHCEPDTRDAIHARTIELAHGAECFTDPQAWIAYDPVHDLGGDRFIRNDAPHSDRTERARLIALFVDATIRLLLHSLSEDESGNWIIEPNMLPEQNPKGSLFESIRHLFCNATGVPTTVLLAGDWSSLQVGTYWMPPVVIDREEPQQYRLEVPINY